jgi:TRAP-type C4-dicarboxylate transport system substrate-binding protein
MPSVLTIFNNVMAALLENSQRRFVMVEMSFIWRWWKRLDEDYKKIIRKLMNEGQQLINKLFNLLKKTFFRTY